MKNELKVLSRDNNQLPLTLEQLKAFLKLEYEIDNGDEDSVVLRSFITAIEQCEKIVGKSILKKTYLYTFYQLPNTKSLKLLYGDVKNINRVFITTKQNTSTEINETQYFLKDDNVIFTNDFQFVNFLCLSIEYEAKMDIVPDELLQGILFHTTKIYEDKTGYGQIPKASLNIYKKYKSINL